MRRMDETALIGSAQRGDLDAFNDLVDCHQDQLFALVARMVPDRDQAHDVVQEAFFSAYRHLASFRGGSVRGWLTRIAVNAALACVRAREPASYLEDDGIQVESPRDWSVDIEGDLERGEIRRHIEDGLHGLVPDMRAAVILHDVEGFTAGEAALILNISQSALKSRLHRGRLLLRRHLAVLLKSEL